LRVLLIDKYPHLRDKEIIPHRRAIKPMSDYRKNIHSREPDPYENISINPIEKDKKGKEDFPKGQEPSKPQFFATLLSYFKKLVTFFTSKDEQEFFLFDSHQLFAHLYAFRKMLLILKDQDESHNPEFTKQLTELWHNLMDDCNSIPASLEVSSQSINNIKFFITQIAHYPYGADHTLKYYFDAYAGKDWIPFPFMDMLKELFEENQSNPSNSHLGKWIFLLDNILTSGHAESKEF
jgi:hypothetical protein